MLCWRTIIVSTLFVAALVLRSYTEAMDRSKGSSVQAVWNRDLKIGVLEAAFCLNLLVLYGFVVLVVCWLVHYMYCHTNVCQCFKIFWRPKYPRGKVSNPQV